MSTRSQLQFGYKNDKGEFERTAMLYNHFDGYPEARLLDIREAINKAHGAYGKQGGYSYRILETYPSDLAAFYILAHKDGAGNIEVDEHLHGDIEYLYQIYQDQEGVFYVRILRPTWGWDDKPSLKATELMDEGELDSLIQKYCKGRQ